MKSRATEIVLAVVNLTHFKHSIIWYTVALEGLSQFITKESYSEKQTPVFFFIIEAVQSVLACLKRLCVYVKSFVKFNHNARIA